MHRTAWICLLAAGCNLYWKRPAADVTVETVVRARAFPADCHVESVAGNCRFETDPSDPLHIACDPVAATRVATIHACGVDQANVSRISADVCRAGGNLVVYEFGVTDSCIEERMDEGDNASLTRISGRALGVFAVYRK